MKKLILSVLGLAAANLYSQVQVGVGVSNNGTYQAEIIAMDSTHYGSKKTMFTLQKGVNVMTYSIRDYDSYSYYTQTGDLPKGNNFYLGTLVRIGTGKQSIVTTDIGFGIGLARIYSSEYIYDPNGMRDEQKFTYEGLETAIGMTWGLNVKIMNNVDTYFKAGGLFKDYGDFATVGFKYNF